jgi:membrane protein DedA with SNARE-associated domain
VVNLIAILFFKNWEDCMSWNYVWVFFGAFLVDVVPFPFFPAFTIMIFLQIHFDLNIWYVLYIGVLGSILGRYTLTIYIPRLSSMIFNQAKNEDVQFLGQNLRQKGWKGQALILTYSLMPLPTTPLFLAAGMANLKPINIIPAFVIGKFVSDGIALFLGDKAVRNMSQLYEGVFSWQSVFGVLIGFLMIFFLLFLDWQTLLKEKRLLLGFNVFKKE